MTNREVVAEVAYRIGYDALAARQSETAVKWLERALMQMQILAAQQDQPSCPEQLDLHVRHTLGEYRSLLRR